MIYRKSCFGHRKSFGLIGSVPGVSGCYRGPSGGVSRPEGTYGLWEDTNQPQVGLHKLPLSPMRFEWQITQKVEKVERVSKWKGGILLLVGLE